MEVVAHDSDNSGSLGSVDTGLGKGIDNHVSNAVDIEYCSLVLRVSAKNQWCSVLSPAPAAHVGI